MLPARVSSFLQRMGRTGRRAEMTRNCLFLATSDEGLLRGAALIELWQRGYVEPVQAPPLPVSHPRPTVDGPDPSGARHWKVTMVSVGRECSRFCSDDSRACHELVEFMVTKGILWSDNGILAFAPEGEATFGRRNFMDILSVFTSPPLFKVMSGQKELGNVHESTFYRKEEGPAILVLAGRSWKTKHLDWKRRIAYVEPTDEKGRSRWLGEGQMLQSCYLPKHPPNPRLRRSRSSMVTSGSAAIRRDSRRTSMGLGGCNQSLSISRTAKSAGGRSLEESPTHCWPTTLKTHCDVKGDNLSLSFPTASSLKTVSEFINGLQLDSVRPIPNIDAMENLKFSECLSPAIAAEVFMSRFDDQAAVTQALTQTRRTIVSN